MSNEYIVTYIIKDSGKQHECEMEIEAQSSREACKMVKDIVQEETGRNAFRPVARKKNAR